ncbi:MAG: hypothetical protein AB7U46_01915 [Paenirhodobacter sp.]|uniref:hypothetical protein n=1 Tax=Paenirhodobacter sp. TaxID=1965326 RepID=UPI003D0EB6F3
MFALFLALTVAVALLLWAELGPSFGPRAKTAPKAAEVADLPHFEDVVQRQKAPAAAESQAEPLATPEGDDAVMARIAAMLAEPAAAPPAPTPVAPVATPETARESTTEDPLPRIGGFAPGDVIELELEGPAPRAEDIRFEQAGRDVRVLIEGIPALILARAKATSLTPEIFRFRSLPA